MNQELSDESLEQSQMEIADAVINLQTNTEVVKDKDTFNKEVNCDNCEIECNNCHENTEIQNNACACSPTNVGTGEEQTIAEKQKVSFHDINPLNLPFKFNYRCSMSTTGQIIQGFAHTSRYLSGTEEYQDDPKPVQNKFQEYLYPQISKLANEIVTKYLEMFVENISDPIKKEVFGANLNGSNNKGQLQHFITCVGISKNVRYKYVQFKNALVLLSYRLNFIAKRNAQTIKRYREDDVQLGYFEDLQKLVTKFCIYLETSVLAKWEEIKEEARKLNDIKQQDQKDELVPVKLTEENVSVQKQNTESPQNTSNKKTDGWQIVENKFNNNKQHKRPTVSNTNDNKNNVKQQSQPNPMIKGQLQNLSYQRNKF